MFRVLLRIHCHSAEFSERYHQIESRFRGAERVKDTRNWIFSENFNTKTVQHLIQKTIMFGGLGTECSRTKFVRPPPVWIFGSFKVGEKVKHIFRKQNVSCGV